jgi:hypothetical protein
MDATFKDGLEQGHNEDKVIKHLNHQRIMSCHEDSIRQEISSKTSSRKRSDEKTH